MKKNIFHVGIMALALLFVFTGCSEDEGRGVLGQVSGVLFDDVTLEPLAGVTATLSGSGRSATTGANGAFSFRDVAIGTQTITFEKDGYRFTSRNVEVDPTAYITDDPFLAAEIIKGQLHQIVDIRDFTGVVTQSDFSWTSEGGLQAGLEFAKLNYTYKKFIPMYVIGITPLSGEITGTLNAVLATFANSTNIALGDAAIVAAAGVEFFFEDDDFEVGFGNVTNTGTAGQGTAWFGPFTTGEDGSFAADGLPVGRDLTLKLNSFDQDGFTFTDDVRVWGATSFVPATTVEALPGVETNVGDIFVFAAADFVTITSVTSTPIASNGSLVLSFSEAMNRAGFSVVFTEAPWQGISLDYSWNAANTTVTITAPDGFPLSTNVNSPVTRMQVTGTSVTGAVVYTATASNGIPIFAEEGIRIVSAEWAPAAAEIPSARAVLARTPAIKLTFNRDVSPNSVFNWTGSNRRAEFTIGTDKTVVWVWTDTLQTGNDTGLTFNVINANNQFDTTGSTAITPPGSSTPISWAPSRGPLFLESTNLYGEPGRLFNPGTASSASSAITLTFTTDLPSADDFDYIVRLGRATVTETSTVADADVVAISNPLIDGKALTVSTNSRLDFGTQYFLSVTIRQKTDTATVLFENTRLFNGIGGATVTGSLANSNIAFTTIPDPAGLAFVTGVRAHGTGSATSSELSGNVGISGITGSTSNLKSGQWYYVEFTGGNLAFTAPAATGLVTSAGADVTLQVGATGNVLRFMFSIGSTVPAATLSVSNVSIVTPIGYVSDVQNNGTINNNTNPTLRQFNIQNITVER